jgi:hypothetical protein
MPKGLEHLPSKCETLSSNTSPAKKKYGFIIIYSK